MAELDFIGTLHKSTKRDYLARVNDAEYPKAKAARLAKRFSYEYWDEVTEESAMGSTSI